MLTPDYRNSYALVIGINNYKVASPLGYAVNDALDFSKSLKTELGFSDENIKVLTNSKATRAAILESYLSFATNGTEVNDRLIVFFAGHGHTVQSSRQEVGYLVPYDGDSSKLHSLIRWDDLTRNADLINAKHILYLMDACYGGLAITRTLRPGAARFLKDMLLRPARQVLTAGKANEVVLDLGGPLPGHSVFTGHLLEGMAGKAADGDGIITANGLMAYVYQRVGRDPDSHQTPHFGYLGGDGDLILKGYNPDNFKNDGVTDEDVLVSVPGMTVEADNAMPKTTVELTKELLSEERYKIKLHDLIAEKTREIIPLLSDERFNLQEQWNKEGLQERLDTYEEIIRTLCSCMTLISYWGTNVHLDTLVLPLTKLCGNLRVAAGVKGWIALRWYPCVLMLYSGGLSAVASEKYENLASLLQTTVTDPEHTHQRIQLVRAIFDGVDDVRDGFKILPNHERNYVPMSEYLYKLLQPRLDDLLFLGDEYDALFDRFEILLGLEYAEQISRNPDHRIWGPVGRFGWKLHRGYGSDPLTEMIMEATAKGKSWGPVQAGMFNGSIERFLEVANSLKKTIGQYAWF